MMKKFTNNKSIVQKIIVILVILILFNVTVPKKVEASFGGAMVDPFFQLLLGLADGTMWLLQSCFTGNWVADDMFINIELENPDLGEDQVWSEDLVEWLGDVILVGTDGDVDICYPIIRFSPEEIFRGKVALLTANFVTPKDI